MKLAHRSIWALIVIAAFSALAFNRHGANVQFYIGANRIFAPGETPYIQFSSNRPGDYDVRFRVFRVLDPIEFFLQQDNIHAPGIQVDSTGKAVSALRLSDRRRYREVSQWQEKMKLSGNYWHGQSIDPKVRDRGVYLIEARSDDLVATTAIVISEYGMILKQSSSEGFAFIVNRRTGKRIPYARVAFARGKGSATEVTANANGVATASLEEGAASPQADLIGALDYQSGRRIVAFAEKDDNFVITDSDYYWYYGYGRTSGKVYFHTDRPVYRPKQTVYYRGIARKLGVDGAYMVPKERTVVVEIRDTRGASIKRDSLQLNDAGTFHGELTLGDEPPLGNYSVTVTVAGEASQHGFAVEEYKKPEYEVVVSTPKEQYLKGDTIRAKVKADYYFGSPVSEGDVQYTVRRERYWRPWWYGYQWAYLYELTPQLYTYDAQIIHSGNGKLAKDGTFDITYPTANEENDFVYTIQANVVDASRRSIAGSKGVKVTRGDLYVTARFDRGLYRPGQKVGVVIGAFPFDGTSPTPTAFDVKVRRVNIPGPGAERREEVIWTGAGRTGSDGQGSIVFNAPESGQLTVEATVRDGHGRDITMTAASLVGGDDAKYWYGQYGTHIVLDRDVYEPGDTLTALAYVNTADSADLLVTIEGMSVYSSRIERLDDHTAMIRVPIESRFAPSAYLVISAYVGDNLYTTTKQIVVAPKEQVMTLQVTTDRAQYKPGERGKVSVRALDSKGRPVANADIALSMVDEALYAIRPDAVQEMQKFFYGLRANHVTTATSHNFRFTGQSMKSRQSLDLVQATSLSAGVTRDSDGSSIRGGRANETSMRVDGVEISDPFSGGFGSVGEHLVQPTLRSSFKDLMHWSPSVRTGPDGRASVDVDFPDNLTTWRITARGITRATMVGQATAEVIARKELLVRMETPRFITQNDQLVIATTVHNYLSTAKRVTVQFETEGLKQKERERVVTIPANDHVRIDWKIEAPTVGTAKLTARALTNEESDAMQVEVPVLPHGLPSATTTLADISGTKETRTLRLDLPKGSAPASSTMRISLAPSAASSMLGALDELIGYPYGCVEQTMSRFLPTVVVASTLEKLDLPFDPAKRKEMPKMVKQGLSRLYALQHGDGGWGWWTNDATHPFMTAYVIYGLTIAREGGYTIDPDRYQQGLAALETQLSNSAGDATTRAYMLYVASRVAEKQTGKMRERIASLAEGRDANTYALALLALAAHLQGDQGTASVLAERLRSAATREGGMASWRGNTWRYNWQDDKVETSAAAVKALLAVEGTSDLASQGVRWLLSQKRGVAWHNTRQTAMVIYALVDYLGVSRELDPDYTMTVRVNGEDVLQRRVTRADLFVQEQQITVDPRLLRAGENIVTIEKSGAGRLYASARLDYHVADMSPRKAGFGVEREYYLLERVFNGGRYIYQKKPFEGTVKSGDEIFVKVKVDPDRAQEYFMLEDPIPAGCEVVTNTDDYMIPGESAYQQYNGYGYYRRAWSWWYADRDVRDEKISFFAPSTPDNDFEFTYIMRAQIPGEYAVMPSVACLMYYPEVNGNSNALALRVVD